MSQLSSQQKREFITKHIPHRLTLLRTFRERQQWLEDELVKNRQHGDLARCAKDSALISIRLLTEAMGIKLKRDQKTGKPALTDECNPKVDDVRIDQLGGELVDPKRLTATQRELLLGVLIRSDKELAHLTSTYDSENNTAAKIVEAITLVEQLVRKHLYSKVGESLPPLDAGIARNKWFFVKYGDRQ